MCQFLNLNIFFWIIFLLVSHEDRKFLCMILTGWYVGSIIHGQRLAPNLNEIQLLEGKGWGHIHRLNPVYFAPSRARTWIFNVIMSWSFLFNDLMYEVIVRFIDVEVIVDYRCINFLFMILSVYIIMSFDFPFVRLFGVR
jgi:hypothetical protein